MLDFTGPKDMSKIVYPMLHLHPHLLVDGFAKLAQPYNRMLPALPALLPDAKQKSAAKTLWGLRRLRGNPPH